MNAREVAELISIVRVGWPTRTVAHHDDGLENDVWTAVLADVELVEARAVITEMLRHGRPHPPALPEITAAVFDLRDRIAGTRAPDVDQMLEEVFRRVRKRGYRLGPPKSWSHPAIDAAVRAIGWKDLCYAENIGVLRSQLIRAYESARERVVREQRTAPEVRAFIESRRAAALPPSGVRSLPPSHQQPEE